MHFTAALIAALPIFAAATAIPETLSRRNQCDTSDQQCCNITQTEDQTGLASLGGLLGLVLPSITGLVGLTCTPISVLALAGTSCSTQPVCCTNNQFNGVIALGCTPLNINA